ncbi:pentapeptide repeat-containing serine/threonine kinase [Scytonema sp. HK-05]|uniref:serine/threonine-protein kinase n=1 Tax=Scytonema sp. HK-05 TaxID=1137095 RepID=UPI0009366732|nr:serine/threonine-protein kinase [Scytonema sp. HK-05]OKH58106.1 serine/threonine protein kinase [Scytonema sp. HK-05]BAY47508.1 pentapeptide repeat-containing serine/threonine kinase [Scytonema sp. HK-05]
MSYCINATCPNPENSAYSQRCQSCGSQLLLRDRYRVIKPLGQGGFGATFLAQDQALPGEPSCVIKQLRPSGTAPQVLQMGRELLEREAVTLDRIGNHPQIPRLLDYFEDGEQLYLVQEYIHGPTLQQEIKRKGVFSEARVNQFLSELLPLLQYIHERKVIHRDIKPTNIIRRAQDGTLVLIDFGAVKNQVSQTLANPTEQTALTAYAIGTPGFAPPEQMAMRPVFASDIYAVGVTCIYLLSGKPPKDLDYNQITGEMLWERLVQTSNHLTVVLRKMLEISVRNRYQSAQEVLTALQLEPYLDSLAQSMLVQSCTVSKERMSQNCEESGVFSINPAAVSGLGVAQVRSAILPKRAKTGETTGTYAVETKPTVVTKPTTLVSTHTGCNTGQNSKTSRRLDTQGLLRDYLKGKRDFALYNLSMLNLQDIDLSQTNFHSSQLVKTNLQGANLYNSNFTKASLNRANLRDANLSKAYLSHADLEGADLRGSDLSYANLNNANLQGANLCGANLTGAKISQEQLALAKMNWMTVRPCGRRGLL